MLVIMASSWWLAGSYTARLDAQGRLPIPRQFRRQITELSSGEVYLEERARYFVVRSMAGYARELRSLADLDDESEQARQVRRELGMRLQMLSLDTQGRMKLPDELIRLDWMQGDLLIVGTGPDFEIRPAV